MRTIDSSPGKELASFSKRLQKVEVIELEDAVGMNGLTPTNQPISGNGTIVLGLTISGAFYANERCLIKDCTSFLVTQAHIIFTTSQHLLKFVHLTQVESKDFILRHTSDTHVVQI